MKYDSNGGDDIAGLKDNGDGGAANIAETLHRHRRATGLLVCARLRPAACKLRQYDWQRCRAPQVA